MPSQKVKVGPISSFQDGSRQLVRVEGRNIAVFGYKGKMYAMDNACYHHGGPLLRGDIEELGGRACIVCPWHSYYITLDTGEGLYRGIYFDLPKAGSGGAAVPKEEVRSKGCKQRVHRVVVEGDTVFVVVDLSGPKVDSDAYATMELANREHTMEKPINLGFHGGGNAGIHSDAKRSGHVFRHNIPPGMNPLMPPGQGGFLQPVIAGTATVHCVRVLPECDGTCEFVFDKLEGTLTRNAELGQYVELRLPIKERDADGKEQAVVRKWTIVELFKNGGLFSVIVKRGSGAGSQWLHKFALFKPLPVVGIKGTFTLPNHAKLIEEYGGRVLMISAGIGITSMYASLNSYFVDQHMSHSSNPLAIVHLHVDRRIASVARLRQLATWHAKYSRENTERPDALEASDPASSASYSLELFFTQQQVPPTDESEMAAATLAPGASTAGSSPAAPLAAATLRRDGNRNNSENPIPAAPSHKSLSHITYGRRIDSRDVAYAIKTHFGTPHLVAMVCGPPAFLNTMSDTLLSLGVDESCILTDDP